MKYTPERDWNESLEAENKKTKRKGKITSRQKNCVDKKSIPDMDGAIDLVNRLGTGWGAYKCWYCPYWHVVRYSKTAKRIKMAQKNH